MTALACWLEHNLQRYAKRGLHPGDRFIDIRRRLGSAPALTGRHNRDGRLE
jgi:hypothetical protein